MSEKPICKECGSDMNFYHSMMTFACLKCHNSIRGIVAWNEKEAFDKLTNQQGGKDE
jgi:tRNA(Ile2) C34 agmatinyltransferase TiaS